MKTRTSLLLHPSFILSLAFLLLNDFYLKYEYHNWFTGKLSDFAGLFASSIFLYSIFPKRKEEVIVTVALFFIWWKSSLSDSFINFCNYQLNFPVDRVIDISDLYALIVLPFTLMIKPIHYPETLIKKLAVGSICIISFIAFTATSLPRRLADDNKVLLDKNIKTKKKEDEIIKTLEKNGLGPAKKEPVFERIWNDEYYLKSNANDSIIIPLDSLYQSIFRRIDNGTGYTIPKMYIANDSITDLQFIISEYDHGKTDVRLYAFKYKGVNADSGYASSYYVWKRFKRPIKKKVKGILKQ
jgi:hypothetical protein